MDCVIEQEIVIRRNSTSAAAAPAEISETAVIQPPLHLSTDETALASAEPTMSSSHSMLSGSASAPSSSGSNMVALKNRTGTASTPISQDSEPSLIISPGSSTSAINANCAKTTLDLADFECPLCFRLFCRPVSTPCGHTYCRSCLKAALRYSASCPLCRQKLELPCKHKYSVNIVLSNVLEKYFEDEYEGREKEEQDAEEEEQQIENEKRESARTTEAEDFSCVSWSSCLIPSVRATCCVLLSCT